MTELARELLRQVLTLPATERADLAAELLASLDEPAAEDPADVQAAWAVEIERRARRVLNGESAMAIRILAFAHDRRRPGYWQFRA